MHTWRIFGENDSGVEWWTSKAHIMLILCRFSPLLMSEVIQSVSLLRVRFVDIVDRMTLRCNTQLGEHLRAREWKVSTRKKYIMTRSVVQRVHVALWNTMN
jgi:hypothetical protein